MVYADCHSVYGACRVSRERKRGRTKWARPCVDVQYFENAGSVSVESTPGMPWTFVTTDSRRFSRGSALMRATMSSSPVVPMISWISGTFFNALMVFCVSVDRMRRYALLACPSFLLDVQSWSAG